MSDDEEEDIELVLRRQPAVRRKGYIWSSKRSVKRSVSEDRDSNREYTDTQPIPPPRRRGSSLDLTPTLLTIYDNKAAENEPADDDPHQEAKLKSQSLPLSIANRVGRGPLTNCHQNGLDKRHTMIDPPISDNVNSDDNLGDNRKRPLSISSMSSTSSSSLPRQQRKRPNLKEYDQGILKGDNSVVVNGCVKDVNGNTKTDSMEIMSARHERKLQQQGKNELSGLKHLESFSKKGEDKLKSKQKPIIEKSDPNKSGNKVLKAIISVKRSLSDADAHAVTAALENHKLSANHNVTNNNVVSNSLEPPSPQLVRAESPATAPDSPDGSQLSRTVPQYVSYVHRVVAEIIDTERTYVKSLEDIIQGYLHYLENTDISVSKDDVNCLFSNIRNIYDFSKIFLSELELCGREPIAVAECFVRSNKGFVIYTEYCTNYPCAVEVLTKFMKDPILSEVFKNRQQKLGHGLPLGAYLLRPVQRILKYHLLLQNIWKNFEKDENGYDVLEQAFKHMTSMAHHINNMKRKHEHAIKIQEIQSQLEDYTGDDLTRLGELVLESSFRVYGARASRHVFLFEKEILICKKKEGGMLSCKSLIQCSNLMLVEVIDNEPLSFHIIPFDNPKAQYTLQARNMEQKRRWCQEIKRLILESYSGKIPEKVKSLVMELGRNHDEDFVSTENLDASRKHQHTAPEYLEKRRVRRKSGGKLPEFHLLKPQKAKRGNRKKSPDRRRISMEENNKLDNRGRPVDVIPRTGQKKSRSLPRGETGIFSDLYSPDRSVVSLDYSLNSPDAEDNSIDITPEVTKRAQSFRRAVRLGPIYSADLSDIKIDLSCKSEGMDIDSDTDDPSLVRDHLEEYNDCMFTSRSDLDEETDVGDQWSALQKSDENLDNCDQYASLPTLVDAPNCDQLKSKSEVIMSPTSESAVDNDSDCSKSFSDLKEPENSKKISGLIRGRPRVGRNWLQRKPKASSENTITAFNDSFRKKSLESLSKDKNLNHSSSSIVQHLSNESDRLHATKGVNAKLTNWSSNDKLLRGSTSSLSHSHEDPWVKNSTKDSVILMPPNSPSVHSWGRPRNISDVTDRRTPSRDNLDWMVYVNRHSLNEYPQNIKFLSKYCSPPKNSVTVQKQNKGVWRSDSTRSDSGVVSYLTQPRQWPQSVNQNNNNCSPKGTNLSRSNSTPCNRKYFEYGKHRPASLDLETLQESDRIMEEMEDYMKNSPNHSLNHAKFPTSIPTHEDKDLNRLSGVSSLSTSSYDSQSSSSDNLVGTLKNKIQTWTTKLSKRNEEYEQMSATSSVSDVRPNSIVLSDEEKYDNGPNDSQKTIGTTDNNRKSTSPKSLSTTHLSFNYHHGRKPVRSPKQQPDLQSVLLEGSLGSSSVGSKLANNLPPNIEAMYAAKIHESSKRPHSACVLRDNDSLSSYDYSSKEGTPEPSSRLSLPPTNQNTDSILPASLNNAEFQQSDSGFSMQSDDVIDSNDIHKTSEIKVSEILDVKNVQSDFSDAQTSINDTKKYSDSPGSVKHRTKERKRTTSNSSAESIDSFYERRLSADLNADVFRDSAVFCDIEIDPKSDPTKLAKDLPTQPEPSHKPARKSIKDYVQFLEEKIKPIPPKTFGVRRREPAAIIKQKLHHLQENSQYRKPSSRSASEERELSPPKCVSEIKSHLVSESNNQYRYRRNRAESEHSDSPCSSTSSTLRPARSLGRLDQLNDTENLVIMKGWVQQLISKFQK